MNSFIILALLKLWLVSGQTVYAIGWAGHDDRLYLNLASAFLKHGWLGHYSNLTLAKGPFYPFWIALTFVSGITLLLSQHLLYIAACVIFIIAVRPIVSRPIVLLLIWTILLSNPMTYTSLITRVVREGIYPALTIFVTSFSMGILVRHDRPLKSLNRWSTGLGCSLSAFWLTREEGVWIMPLVLMVIGLAAVRMLQTRPIDWRRLSLVCALPFCIWITVLGAVAGINKIGYGVFATVEFKSRDFLEAYGALSRVMHANWQRFVPVPEETRERIYEVSPAFAELNPFLEGDIGKGWSYNSCRGASICNDIGGGWFMWAFRDAAAAAGHHKTGAAAASFYRRLATEVNAACADGRLECRSKRATLVPPWRDEYFRPLLSTMARAAFYLARFEGFDAHSVPSEGSEESLLLFRDLTRDRLSPVTLAGRFPKQAKFDDFKIAILGYIGKIYQIVMPVFIVAAFMVYMIRTALMIKKRTVTRIWMINGALLAAIIIRLFIVSMIEVTSFPAICPLYLAPAYPQLLMFVILSFSSASVPLLD